MIIGIPRALIYWKRPCFWEDFFENLGFEVLISPPTNKEIVEKGVKAADPETCFSNKVYWGHLLWLDGKCDLIFTPRLKTKKTCLPNSEDKFGKALEYCPKLFGLPDLAKILVKTPILTETFDERKEKFEKTIEKLGKKLKKDKETIKKAMKITLLQEKELSEKEKKDFLGKIQSKKRKIILISHPYNLYDEYINLRIKEKIEKLGAEPVFIEKVPVELNQNIDQSFSILPTNFHWEFGKEIMEKINQILKYDVAGAIEISSFQCGCDAVLKEYIEKEFKTQKTPFLYLIIDEQTGEAGLQTRLEAFIDTI